MRTTASLHFAAGVGHLQCRPRQTRMADKDEQVVLNSVQLDPFVHLSRAHTLVYACSILALFYHRLLSLISSTSYHSFLLFLSLTVADLVLAFLWALKSAFFWRPVRRREFPERLTRVMDREDWPALDVFLCTADPYKEPPMIVVNTALSVMGFDYPTNKLSVYVSDDGGSHLTLFALMEAARFARHWLPFCRERGLTVDRSPEVYFNSSSTEHIGDEHDNQNMKMLYERMKNRVERAVEKGCVNSEHLAAVSSGEEQLQLFERWTTDFSRQQHPTVIQVLLDNSKDVDITDHSLPNLIYVSREKKRNCDDHFKAGALNVLIRVSGEMTNAPVILTVDCDMISNDPQTPQRALCHFYDARSRNTKLAFVQFPQRFRGINEHDIYAGELKEVFQIQPYGMDGFRGPIYMGTGSFFSRTCLDHQVAKPRSWRKTSLSSASALASAHLVASCTYEFGTKWGHKVGMRYGSLVEDLHTGYRLHCEGWESKFCNPRRPAFLGSATSSLNDSLNQIKRWCIGLLEISLSKRCPLINIAECGGIGFLPMSFQYSSYVFYWLYCIPLWVYAVLPQVALAYGVPIFPKASDPWWFLYAYLFLASSAFDLIHHWRTRGTFRQWWNDQRMWMARAVACYPFAIAEPLLYLAGFPAMRFNVTSKATDGEKARLYSAGRFDFGVDSPYFVSLGTIALVNLASLVVGLVRGMRASQGEAMLMQVLMSGFVTVNCWPVYEAMAWRNDVGRLTTTVTMTSLILAAAAYSIAYLVF